LGLAAFPTRRGSTPATGSYWIIAIIDEKYSAARRADCLDQRDREVLGPGWQNVAADPTTFAYTRY
jgi:hypothetical protein